jgi:hypothetical protein
MGRPERAEEYVCRGFDLLSPDQKWYGLPAPLYLAQGMLMSAQGKSERATMSFKEAANINRRYGLPWAEGRVLHEWGVMVGKMGNKRAATEKLHSALALYQKVDAKKDVKKVLAQLEALDRTAG